MYKNKKETAYAYKCEQTIYHIYWNKTEIRYKTWIKSNKASQYKIRYLIRCQVYSQFIGIVRCLQSGIYIEFSLQSKCRISVLSLIMSANTNCHMQWRIPYYATTRVNQGPKLLKLIVGDIVHALSGSRTYPGPRPQMPVVEPGLYC